MKPPAAVNGQAHGLSPKLEVGAGLFGRPALNSGDTQPTTKLAEVSKILGSSPPKRCTTNAGATLREMLGAFTITTGSRSLPQIVVGTLLVDVARLAASAIYLHQRPETIRPNQSRESTRYVEATLPPPKQSDMRC